MSTISSPRPSIASSRAPTPTPTSSRRPSLDHLNNLSVNSTSTTTARNALPVHRRNRAALRDYYNLKPAGLDLTSNVTASHPQSARSTTDVGDLVSPSATAVSTELDSPDFDAQRYIEQLLTTSPLSTVLKAENTLVGDIRTLDGERKALVYDNYSKLIRAVETIGTMRQSMEERGAPLTMTKSLGPAVGFVAETASSIIREGEELRRQMKAAKDTADDQKTAQRQTVQWVLRTPERLSTLVNDGKRKEAEEDWTEVDRLLRKWEGVKGVEEVRHACEEILGNDQS
jgi:hypothetical protein